MSDQYHNYCVPGEADSSADPIGIPQYPCGDDVTQGLQHVLQLLLVHRHRQVGDVQVGGVLLLLLQGQWLERGGEERKIKGETQCSVNNCSNCEICISSVS